MPAIIYCEFGGPDVLQFKEIEKPTPADNQILVKVRVASVNPLDWHFMEGKPKIGRAFGMGLRKPKATRIGVDFAGTVEAVGKSVTQFKPGDDVFGGRDGALAGYVCPRENGSVVLKPAGVTFEQAASLGIAGITALQGLRDKGNLESGEKVLINGASGGVGTFAVQIARSMGAEVTGVCSGRNADMVRSLGAAHVIDYTKEDFTQSAQRYDLILDIVPNHSLSECRRILTPKGRYVMIGGGGPDDKPWIGPFGRIIAMLVSSPFASQKMSMMLAEFNKKDLTFLADLITSGKMTPAIDRRYKLSEASEALRYLEKGHARGKVIITME